MWVVDRLGRDRPDLSTVLDPITVLTYAAACTSRVRLGTSVLVAPWYRPALLARSLTSLDVLSDGRLTVGLGLGATLDEFAAVGVPHRELDRRLDDALDVLEATWSGPARRPTGSAAGDPTVTSLARHRPPVLLDASTREGLDRVARRADGWNPSGLAVDVLAPMWATVRDLAAGHGRDPTPCSSSSAPPWTCGIGRWRASARPYSRDRRAGGGRPGRHAPGGAHEVILGVECDNCLDEALDIYARVAEACDVTAAA